MLCRGVSGTIWCTSLLCIPYGKKYTLSWGVLWRILILSFQVYDGSLKGVMAQHNTPQKCVSAKLGASSEMPLLFLLKKHCLMFISSAPFVVMKTDGNILGDTTAPQRLQLEKLDTSYRTIDVIVAKPCHPGTKCR